MLSKEWYQQKSLEYYIAYHEAVKLGNEERAKLTNKWYKHYSEGGRK